MTPHIEWRNPKDHDSQCESELTSHGYTPCRCEERDWRICGCGRRYYRSETVNDECESCYNLRMSMGLSWTRMEQNINIASDLYESRRAAKFLLGGSYTETLKPYRDLIRRVMTAERLPVLRAALKIGQSIPACDPIPLMCVLAAAVEMMEEPASVDAVDLHADIRESGPRA